MTFSARPASRIYSPRNYFGAGIFTNSTASGNRGDVMFVMGGRVPPSAASPYGGVDLNDVWLTTNYGYAWVQVSASAPWSARDSLNVAVSNYGVIAVYGGSVYGGSAGWLDDTWVSLDGGYLWTQLAGSGQLNNRSQAAILFDALGYLNVWFGQEAPAYNWSTDGWKSAYSFNNIQQWGPLVNPSFSLTTLSPGYSACAPINYQGGAAAAPGSGSSSSGGAAPPPSGGGGLFDLLQQPQMNQSIYNRVASAMASLVAPVVWEANQQQTQVAQLTTWLLWGTQPDVDITLNAGLNFTTIAGSSRSLTWATQTSRTTLATRMAAVDASTATRSTASTGWATPAAQCTTGHRQMAPPGCRSSTRTPPWPGPTAPTSRSLAVW